MKLRKNILKLIVLAMLLFLGYVSYNKSVICSSNVVIDGELTLLECDSQGLISTSGKWEFYPNTTVNFGEFDNHSQDKVMIDVPSKFNNIGVDSLKDGNGFGTYRLKIKNELGELSIKLPIIFTAVKVYADDELLFESGEYSEQKLSSEPNLKTSIIDLPNKSEFDLIIYVSNYDHAYGGIREDIRIGKRSVLHEIREINLMIDFSKFAFLFAIGMYNALLYGFRSYNKETLYFGIVCILMALRTTMLNEYIINYFLSLEYIFLLKLEYVTLALLIYYFVKLIQILFIEYSNEIYRRILGSFLLLFSIVVVFTGVNIFTRLLIVIQLIIIVSAFYSLSINIKAIKNKNADSKILLFGMLALSISVLNDILLNQGIIQGMYLADFGVIIYLFTYNYIISENYSRAYRGLKETLKTLESTQVQLVKQEKLAGVGLLSAGIAHEINNPLGFISSNFEILMDYFMKVKNSIYDLNIKDVDKEEFLKANKLDFIFDDLEDIFSDTSEGISRISEIIKNLRDFSRMDSSVSKELFDINSGLMNTLKIVESEYKFVCEVETRFGELPEVLCWGSELNQVFMNILINSIYAIKSKGLKVDSGKILITTEMKNDEIIVVFKDNGIVIKLENLKKIFDPFFTTKTVGEGTGLGLGIVYEVIVNKHDGKIEVNSEYGLFTEMKLFIPKNRSTHNEDFDSR